MVEIRDQVKRGFNEYTGALWERPELRRLMIQHAEGPGVRRSEGGTVPGCGDPGDGDKSCKNI